MSGLSGLSGLSELSERELRERRSVKWRRYPPDVLPLWVAELDVPLAEPVAAALAAAVRRGDTGYADPGGLGEAYAGFAAERFGWEVPPSWVTAVPDVMTGVAAALHLLTAPGAAVVINPPVYPPFFAVLAETGRRCVEVPLLSGEGYRLDLEGLDRAFAAGASTYLLCNPHNPTGRVFTAPELQAVAELADRYGATVLADEIHAPLVGRGRTHLPFARIRPQRTVVLTSASKAWNLPGLKCGLVVAGDAAVAAALEHLPERVRYATGLYGVLGSVAAFTAGGPWLDDLLTWLDGNRRLLADLLAARLPDVSYRPPEAGYLAWLDCRTLGVGDDPAAVFLERGRLALSSGPDFGAPGRGFARLNFGTPGAILTEAVDRMAYAVQRG